MRSATIFRKYVRKRTGPSGQAGAILLRRSNAVGPPAVVLNNVPEHVQRPEREA